jgi:23S rRNA-/tRNA-specific pseudouridylate synthase
MPFIDASEPYIIDISHGVAAIFKPCGWHSTSHRRGDISVPSWFFEHEDILPASELKNLIHERSALVQSDDLRKDGAGDRFRDELGMLYRLDRDTSGILLSALDRSTMERMGLAQDKMTLRKRYMLVCSGSNLGLPGSMPKTRYTERAAFLERLYARQEVEVASHFSSYGPLGARVSCILPELAQKTKRKITRDIYLTEYLCAHIAGAGDVASLGLSPHAILLEAEIRRGFRHQIRTHSAWMGLPIVGDSLYGGAPSKRLFLEAFSVTLDDGAHTIAEWALYNGN